MSYYSRAIMITITGPFRGRNNIFKRIIFITVVAHCSILLARTHSHAPHISGVFIYLLCFDYGEVGTKKRRIVTNAYCAVFSPFEEIQYSVLTPI